MIRLLLILKIVGVNMAIFVLLVATSEVVLGYWLRDNVYCLDEVLHHAYCPGITNVTRLPAEDGGITIESHIDRSQVRVASRRDISQSTDISRFDVINVGDSFIQADEIPFGKTIGSIAARGTGKAVLDFGYSSWAPFVYFNWMARQKLRRGVRVNVFVMVNDMTPNYPNSSLNYRRQAKPDGKGLYHFDAPPRDNSIEGILSRYSYFYNKVLLIRHRILIAKYFTQYNLLNGLRANQSMDQNPGNELPWLDGEFSVPSDDCTVLDRYRMQQPFQYLPGYLTVDYLSFVFSPDCWSAEQRAEVHATAEDLNRIIEFVERVHGSVRVYIIPAGFSFYGENLIGKSEHRLRPNTTITSLPVSIYLAKLVRAPVVPLEPVIKEQKARYPGLFYFPRDGHWTPHAHYYLGQWLAEQIQLQ